MTVPAMAAPNISLQDISSFHNTHFSTTSASHFAEHFLGPVDELYQDQAEDDGLGHYPDGVKRTLTDEQIAIFRHSEIEALLRDRRHAEENRDSESDVQPSKYTSEAGDLEDGELQDEEPKGNIEITETPTPLPSKNASQTSKKAQKLRKAKQNGYFKQNVKPDLRKRTWDKVDAGMDSLAYDDEGASSAAPTKSNQRRRISYDDD